VPYNQLSVIKMYKCVGTWIWRLYSFKD